MTLKMVVDAWLAWWWDANIFFLLSCGSFEFMQLLNALCVTKRLTKAMYIL